MISTSGKIAVVLFLTALAAPAHGGPKPGDKAPILTKLDWVKGGPVDLAKNPDRKLHLVEFWATWCPPCKQSIPLLTGLQKKFASDLVIVGITAPDNRGNTWTAVKRFVERQGSKMDYVVAFDKAKAATSSYMTDIIGIPHCFLVTRDGKVAWQGSPLDATLEGVIRRVLDGTWDMKVQAEVTKRLDAMGPKVQTGDWKGVREGLEEILKLDPASELALFNLFPICVNELDDQAGLHKWVESHLRDNKDRWDVLHLLASMLCATADFTVRNPELAFEAARGAYELRRHSPLLDVNVTYALALYQTGAVDRAVAIQEEALAIATAAERQHIETVLGFYKRCKRVRDGLGE